MFFLLPLNVLLAGCHGGAAVATKLNRINQNARRIETSNYLHYSGIYKVSGFLGAKIAHNASANVCIIKKKGVTIKG